MATAPQIEANRRNAQKSTGPQTPRGKARSRINALKHGRRARIVPPVLPQEDPRQLEACIQNLRDSIEPQNALEEQLIERVAQLSWGLDRLQRHETATLTHRIRIAPRLREQQVHTEVLELGRCRLAWVGIPAERLNPRQQPEPHPTDPAGLVDQLQATPEGCRWLLDRWEELKFLNATGLAWQSPDRYKLVRLLGKQPHAATEERELSAIFQAWNTLTEDDAGTRFWQGYVNHMPPHLAPGFHGDLSWRELTPRPESKQMAWEWLQDVISREIERLTALATARQAERDEEWTDLADRMAFDPGPEGERLRKHQASQGPKLVRTLSELIKLLRAVELRSGNSGPPDDGDGDSGQWSVISGQTEEVEEPAPKAKPISAAEPALAIEPEESCPSREEPVGATQPQGVSPAPCLPVSRSPCLRAEQAAAPVSRNQGPSEPGIQPQIRPNEAKCDQTQLLQDSRLDPRKPASPAAERTQFGGTQTGPVRPVREARKPKPGPTLFGDLLAVAPEPTASIRIIDEMWERPDPGGGSGSKSSHRQSGT